MLLVHSHYIKLPVVQSTLLSRLRVQLVLYYSELLPIRGQLNNRASHYEWIPNLPDVQFNVRYLQYSFEPWVVYDV